MTMRRYEKAITNQNMVNVYVRTCTRKKTKEQNLRRGDESQDEFERGQNRGEHGKDCGGGAGMVRLRGVPCGSRGKREGMCRKRAGRAEVWEGWGKVKREARPNPNYHHGFAASYHPRSSMATTFQCHYIGPKPQMLRLLATTSAQPGLRPWRSQRMLDIAATTPSHSCRSLACRSTLRTCCLTIRSISSYSICALKTLQTPKSSGCCCRNDLLCCC